ncbi:hypothetical protein PPYR_11947 [Photinus pyralis]|uniref:F-box domain-containing protein n=1 Tax=Photinus pyralis TaxID=7054 RepID=A0A1Y1LFS0_PHOPY|nr:S-phase kinase-associated protein 2 [Photinus pyralis]KAB0795108.1 hypothetical protein PPYR_11947 [Photinus pyralis]
MGSKGLTTIVDKLGESSISPARKRSRFDPSLGTENNKKWSFLKSSSLENLSDIGVGPLIGDSPEDALADTFPDFLDITQPNSLKAQAERDRKLALVLQSTLSKETLQKLSANEWERLLLCRPKRDIVYKLNHFQQLSDEVILHIFYWLPKRCLKMAALVCRRWHRLSQDESLWSRMDASHRHLDPGALGNILSRQAIILRLAHAKVAFPPFIPGMKAYSQEFRSRLLYLDLSMATINQEALTMLFSKCRRLKKLSLEHVPVDNNVLFALSRNRELEILNLAMVEGITLEGFHHILANCRKLKELNVAWTYLNSQCLKLICSNLPLTVDRLNLSGCRKCLSDESVLDLVKSCPNLRELDLSDCTTISCNSIDHIVRLGNLNFLALSRCYFINYRSIILLKEVKSLMYLDVHGGHIDQSEIDIIQKNLGGKVNINKFKFSSIARPTVGPKRSTIWGLRVRD